MQRRAWHSNWWIVAAALAMALGVARPSLAAPDSIRVPITLPAGEDPTAWRTPLEAAGLELALSARGAAVRIEAGGPRWRLVAVENHKIVRELFVQSPRTETDRRELAVLARALSQGIRPPELPDSPSAPPPPPLVWLTVPEPVVQEIEPPPAPKPTETDEPEPEPAFDELEPEPMDGTQDDEGVAPPPTRDLAPWWPFRRRTEPREPNETRPRKRRKRVSEAPPTALFVGASFREGVEAAGAFGVQTDAFTTGPFSLTTEFAVQPARGFPRFGDEVAAAEEWWRHYIDLRGLVGAGLRLSPGFRVHAVAGAAHRTYRQQFRPVRTSVMPVVGGQVEAVAGGLFRFGVRLQALTDLRMTTLEDSLGVTRSLSPLDVAVHAVFRVHPRQRKRVSRTSPEDTVRERVLDPIDLESLPEQ